MRIFLVREELINAVIEYLSTRPWRESNNLIQSLAASPQKEVADEAKPETPAPDEKPAEAAPVDPKPISNGKGKRARN